MITIQQLNEIDMELDKRWYSLKTKKAKLKVRDKSMRINRIRSWRMDRILKEKDLITLNETVWFFTVFPTGGCGTIKAGATLEVLGVYSEKIVVGCGGDCLEIPYVYGKFNNFNESTFTYQGRAKPKLKVIQGGAK